MTVAEKVGTPDPVIETLLLADIRIDPDLQCRANGINKRTVAEYAEALRNGAVFPPVVVFKDKAGVYWLCDGFQRHAARMLAFPDAPEIAAEIREGSRKDALVFAAGANASHGLRRTNADKKRAVSMMLTAFPKWSDRRISEAVGVGNKFVGDVRRAVCPEHSSDEREGLDGKVRAATVAESTPVADALEKPLAKFRALVALVPEPDRARFADMVLAMLSTETHP